MPKPVDPRSLSDAALETAIETAAAHLLQLKRQRAGRRRSAWARANPDKLKAKYPPAVRAKMSESAKRRSPMSAATKRAIARGMKLYWRMRRAAKG